MRRSWPDASEASRFEGRVLTRGTALVDFRLPVKDGAFRAADESVVFVAPALAPLPGAPASPMRAREVSFPGAHWLTPPPELPDEVRARMSRPDPSEVDDDELTLPVIPLSRRRSAVDALASTAEAALGHTAGARVARIGVVVSLVFAGLAGHALEGARPSLDELGAMGDPHGSARASRVRPAAAPATVAERSEALRAPEPVVISGAAPVWIVVRPAAAPVAKPSAPEPAPAETLGLPRPPPPPPRSEFARL